MKQKELFSLIAGDVKKKTEIEVEPKVVGAVYEATGELIANTLLEGDDKTRLEIPHIGTFSTVYKKAVTRNGRNPQTGEPLVTHQDERYVIKYKPYKKLAEAYNIEKLAKRNKK